MHQRFNDWVERYVKAWNSNAREDIESLFAVTALYYTEPYAQPWRGRDQIVAGWLRQKDEPGDTDFRYEVIAVEGDLGVVRGTTDYKTSGKSYSNLWLIRLDGEGRAVEFVEYWMLIKT
ncbi:MAG TPA: nuclear transport factor 2 family protein [Actinomycetota bacterium]|nr:nuclear transport factor 2 family protein [Actinomycetota bacterium]